VELFTVAAEYHQVKQKSLPPQDGGIKMYLAQGGQFLIFNFHAAGVSATLRRKFYDL
jgi:hypothetical protein